MSSIRLTPDEKFDRHINSMYLSLIGAFITAFSVQNMIDSRHGYPAATITFPLSLIIALLGIGGVGIAIALVIETWRAETITFGTPGQHTK